MNDGLPPTAVTPCSKSVCAWESTAAVLIILCRDI